MRGGMCLLINFVCFFISDLTVFLDEFVDIVKED